MAQSFDLHQAPGHLVRRAHQRTVALFMEEAAAFDVTPVQFAILNALLTQPGEDQITLAGRVALDAATLGAVITRLQARGLIRRESDPGDRRRKLLWLTSEGEVLARQLIAPAQRVQERLMAPLPPEEQVLLQQLLARLVFSEER
jgi:DNA-binding MarR family transcriptional regulator